MPSVRKHVGESDAASAVAKNTPLTVKIDARDIVCRHFLGFGAEWDSRNYPAAGIGESEFSLVRRRIEWMRLPVTRIMMQARWAYRGSGAFDWETPEMTALYRHLDVCQRLGTTVFLAEWGCEPAWLRCPDVAGADDPRYAEIIGAYMDHLVNRRGYDCIRYFIFVNEPNFEVKDVSRWQKGVRHVHAELRKRGLSDHVRLAGSDHSCADDWHRMAVDRLQNCLGAYDVHKYANDSDIRPGKLGEYFQSAWDYAREHDPRAAEKPMIVGEAGLNDQARHPHGNLDIDKPSYGLLMADYAVQAANAGSAAVIAWMLDDNSHPDFFWGLWTSKAHGLKLRPWFRSWSLFSRLFQPGSSIARVRQPSPDIRILAASHSRPGHAPAWTFCAVNRSEAPRSVRLRVADALTVEMNRYLYGQNGSKTDVDGFPRALDRRAYDLGNGATVSCPPESVSWLDTQAERETRKR